MQAAPSENLKDVALKILQNGVAAVPIIYSSPEDGSYPQLLHLTSLSEILKCEFLLIWILSGLNDEVKKWTKNNHKRDKAQAGWVKHNLLPQGWEE